MKKILVCFLVLSMFLTAGCGTKLSQEPETTAAAPTTETTVPTTAEPETQPRPDTEPGTILADQVPVILRLVSRGETLDVVADYDENHVAVKLEEGFGLVPKNLIRMEGAEAFEPFTGYSGWNAGIYHSFELSGEPFLRLGQNTSLEVLEDLGTCYLVKLADGTLGFADQKQISRWPFYSGGGSDDSGSGGGVGQDGGDITMGIQAQALAVIEQKGRIIGKAEVLADGAPVILGYFDRGETVPVLVGAGFAEAPEGYVTLCWDDDMLGYVKESFLRKADTPAFAVWEGFAGNGARAYDNFRLTGKPLPNVWVNRKVRVLEELGDVCLVEVNGTLGYMARESVSETAVPVYQGGGDGDSGGSSGPEWSDPVL